MKMNESQIIVNAIFRESYTKDIFTIEEIISLISSKIFGFDQIEAESYADRNKQRVWNLVVKRIDEESNKGINKSFEIIDASRHQIAWWPMIKIDDDTYTKQRKTRLALRGKLLDFMDDNDNVDDRAYEALGCLVVQLAGATHWHLTPPGNEFGIDFLAILPADGKCHLFPNPIKELRIVGQSKKWTSRVNRDKVDLLAHRLDDIRRKNERILAILPPWFIASAGLLVGCLIAHSGTQSGGHDIANDHGIILADSRDIAEIVALSEECKLSDGSKGLEDFIRSKMSDILNISR